MKDEPMTFEELKKQADALGYNLTKKPCYQCSCYEKYPNERYKHKNGNWKCTDKYKPIDYKSKSAYGPITHCVVKVNDD